MSVGSDLFDNERERLESCNQGMKDRLTEIDKLLDSNPAHWIVLKPERELLTRRVLRLTDFLADDMCWGP